MWLAETCLRGLVCFFLIKICLVQWSRKGYARQSNIIVYGMRSSQLHDDAQQKDPAEQAGNEEVLQPLPQACGSQGNKIKSHLRQISRLNLLTARG